VRIGRLWCIRYAFVHAGATADIRTECLTTKSAIFIGDAEPSPVFLAVWVAKCCSHTSKLAEFFVQLLDELLVWWMRHTVLLR
jgi:hypothetical protein